MSEEQCAHLYGQLLQYIGRLGSVVAAFSGGVDSTFLVRAVQDAGVDYLAVTALSPTMPEQDRQDVARLVQTLQLKHRFIESGEMDDAQFVRNDFNRCYYCKSDLFIRLTELARREGYAWVLDGSTVDDAGDYRPGMRARGEQGVESPLWAVGLGKEVVRELARWKGLANWNKPASPCLSSRISYGEPILNQSLRMVEAAEGILRGLGLTTLRVRKQGETARIELLPEDFPCLLQEEVRQRLTQEMLGLGFKYVTLDLEGFQSGKLNRVIPIAKQSAADQ
ncbi:ATP-dependent sacrificial sulfur transferase LarE [Candidatus Magnetaquicoccus inordinatus]|uniref:ATP-dependent sacrificial sulfur transferase LarE n=1 Tax=Candidatus Magnetaquicoccus inordinatus TaxID=2496818 RepID=UPI00187D45FD|nr:ATP-dependent sacrificial sulfur transferase LarE [Candidatus Magnetaquicoccus inordinatus]